MPDLRCYFFRQECLLLIIVILSLYAFICNRGFANSIINKVSYIKNLAWLWNFCSFLYYRLVSFERFIMTFIGLWVYKDIILIENRFVVDNCVWLYVLHVRWCDEVVTVLSMDVCTLFRGFRGLNLLFVVAQYGRSSWRIRWKNFFGNCPELGFLPMGRFIIQPIFILTLH